jgi:hypothetical protein
MTRDEAMALPLGLYRIFWDDDDAPSLASVGQCHDGTRWFAPSNWTCAVPDAPSIGSWPIARVATTDWSQVSRVERIEV